MAASVIASKFTPENLALDAQTVPSSRVVGGVPSTLNGTVDKITRMYSSLIAMGCAPRDNPEYVATEVALHCLHTFSTVVESIPPDEPIKTLIESAYTPQNSADMNNQMNKKNYGDEMFPDQNDPFYQMDELPPEQLQQPTFTTLQQTGDLSVIVDMISIISQYQFDMPQVNNRFKLKYFDR